MSASPRGGRGPFVCCMAILLLAGAGMHAVRLALGAGQVKPLAVPLSEFPQQIGPWMALSTGLPDEQLELLRVSDVWAATYADPVGKPISLFIAYYADESIAKLHQPTICYPGAGWVAVRNETVPIHDGDGPGIRVNRVVFKRGLQTKIVLYWFCLPDGQTITNPAMAKVAALSRLWQGRKSPSVIKVQIDVPVVVGVEESMETARGFVARIREPLARHLGPEWAVPHLAGPEQASETP